MAADVTSGSSNELSRLDREVCIMEASLPTSMIWGPHGTMWSPTWGDCGGGGGGGEREGGEGRERKESE